MNKATSNPVRKAKLGKDDKAPTTGRNVQMLARTQFKPMKMTADGALNIAKNYENAGLFVRLATGIMQRDDNQCLELLEEIGFGEARKLTEGLLQAARDFKEMSKFLDAAAARMICSVARQAVDT
jgi:hypothetical protein